MYMFYVYIKICPDKTNLYNYIINYRVDLIIYEIGSSFTTEKETLSESDQGNRYGNEVPGQRNRYRVFNSSYVYWLYSVNLWEDL